MPRKKSAPPVPTPASQAPSNENSKRRRHRNSRSRSVLHLDTRHYRIRGLENNHSPHQLRVNILATRDDLVHLDTLDLCKASTRLAFIRATASELYLDEAVVKKDVGRLLLELERLRESQIEAATQVRVAKVELSAADRRAAAGLPAGHPTSDADSPRLRRLWSGR